jgi:hypothetical protein
MSQKTFLLKEEHLKLLKRAYITNYNCEFGSPAIDCKRPFGNSDVIGDMAEILGYEYESDMYEDEGDIDREELESKLYDLYQELYTAVKVIFYNLPNVKLGNYVCDDWGCKWEYMDGQ